MITLRHNSRLHHIGLGRRHAGTNVLVLVHDLHIRVLNTDGELLRELHLDPRKDYQPQPKTSTMSRDTCADVPRHHTCGAAGTRTHDLTDAASAQLGDARNPAIRPVSWAKRVLTRGRLLAETRPSPSFCAGEVWKRSWTSTQNPWSSATSSVSKLIDQVNACRQGSESVTELRRCVAWHRGQIRLPGGSADSLLTDGPFGLVRTIARDANSRACVPLTPIGEDARCRWD